MIRKRLFVLGLYLVIFVVSIITETLSARTATEIKRLEQDTVIQGIKFPKGTDFGFYESGELKLVVLSQNQVIGGIKWHKENVLYFSKSGSIEDFFLSQSQDKVKKIQEILVRDFPEMKKYPNFLEAMAVIVKNEKLLEYIEKKEVRRYIKERFQTFKEKENLRTASAETLSYFVKYKCNDIYFHEHKSNFLSIPTRKPLERLDYLEKKIFPLSKKIVGRAKNDFEAIEKIACWTRKKIQGICICENRSRTIEILAQGAGIPSRYISGVVKEGKKGHAWIECHLEKKWLAVTSTGYLGKKTLLTREDLKRIGDTVLYARYSNPFYSHLYKGNNSLAYNYRALKVTVDSTRKYFTKSALKKVSELLKNWQKELDYNKRNLIGHQIMKSCLKEVVAKKEGISQNEVLPIYLWNARNRSRWRLEIEDKEMLKKIKAAKAICLYHLITSSSISSPCFPAIGSNDELFQEKLKCDVAKISKNSQARIYGFFVNHKLEETSHHSCEIKKVSTYLLTPKAINEFNKVHQRVKEESVRFLKSFIDEIKTVQEGKKFSYFYLPEKLLEDRITYKLGTCIRFPSRKGGKCKLEFQLKYSSQFEGLQIKSSFEQSSIATILYGYITWTDKEEYRKLKEKQKKIKERYDSFSDIKLVNRQGRIYGKPPYYKIGVLCGLRFKEPQKIKIERGKDGLITIIANFEKTK